VEHPAAGFRLREHVADLGLDAWGPDLPSAFAQAVRGLAEVVAGPAAFAPVDTRPVRVREQDAEAALVALLQEVLYAIEVHAWLASGADLTEVGEGALDGDLAGEPIDAARHGGGIAVKAVTWHGLAVRRTATGVALSVVLDV
jgi:SHS2 domain-containing protein